MKKIAAIDVGTTKIVTIVGESSDDAKIKIVKWHQSPSAGIEKGNVVNIPQIVQKIKENLNHIYDSLPNNKEFFVGVAGQYIYVKRTKTNLNFENERKIDDDVLEKLEKKAAQIQINEDEEVVEVLSSSFLIDDERPVKNPIDKIAQSSIEGDFLIVIAKITNLSNLKTSVKTAGINIKSLCLEPVASSLAVLRGEDKKTCVAILDIGGGTSDLAVYEDGKLIFVAVIPVGGQYITNSIAEKFSIDNSLAEKIKVQFGLNYYKDTVINYKEANISINSEDVFNIIKESYKKIFSAVLFQLKTISYKDKVKRIIITGGGSKTKNLSQFANYCTNYEVRIAGPSLSSDSAAETDNLNDAQYSTAVGLLQLAAKYYKNESVKEEEEGKDKKEGKNNTEKEEHNKKKNNFFEKIFNSNLFES